MWSKAPPELNRPLRRDHRERHGAQLTGHTTSHCCSSVKIELLSLNEFVHLRFATLSVCAMGTTPLVALLALTAGVEGLAWLLGGVITSIILSRTVCTVRTVRTTCSDGTSTALIISTNSSGIHSTFASVADQVPANTDPIVMLA
jgi:hypothetical protein